MVLQAVVDENKRGRVMSFYVMAFNGAAPVGSLIAGAVSSKAGAPVTVFICGSVCLILGIIFSFRIQKIGDSVREAAAVKLDEGKR